MLGATYTSMGNISHTTWHISEVIIQRDPRTRTLLCTMVNSGYRHRPLYLTSPWVPRKKDDCWL